MDPIAKFQTMLVTMQAIAFILGILFGITLEKRRQINEQD